MVLTKAMQVRVAHGFYYVEGRLMTADDMKWLEPADVKEYLDAARSQMQAYDSHGPYGSPNAANATNAEAYDQAATPAADQTQVESAAPVSVQKKIHIRRMPLIAAGVLAGIAGVWAITAAIVSSGHSSIKQGSSLAADAASTSNANNRQGQQTVQNAGKALSESATPPVVTTPAPVTPLTKPSSVAKTSTPPTTTTPAAPPTTISQGATTTAPDSTTPSETSQNQAPIDDTCQAKPDQAKCETNTDTKPKTSIDCTDAANAQDPACIADRR